MRHIQNRAHGISLRCAIVLLALAGSAFAQQKQPALDFKLDPATTAIHWTLNTTVHTVHGTFLLKDGSIHIDPATGDVAGLIVIDATSGESGDSSRDSRMHSVVLESAKYPTITFRPTYIDGKFDLGLPGPIVIDGVMNLHGQDHPMQMTVDLHPRDAAIASHTHFTIPFVAWGLKDPSVMMFRTDKQVAIDIDALAIHSPDSAR